MERARLGFGSGRGFGSGWLSGVLSVTFAGLGYGGVLCLLFPDLLTTPTARPYYPLGLVRVLIHAFLAAGFGLGALSVVLRRRKTLGLTGIAMAVAATLLGGAGVEPEVSGTWRAHAGLDWFLLNLLVLALVFVPLERLRPRRPDQDVFRPGWDTDLAHFAVSHLGVQLTALLTLVPATVLFHWTARPGLQAHVAAQPVWLQVIEVVVVADLAQYAVHRAFHRVPALWRFHRIHHSSERMDWLAGSRLHLVDIAVTRGLSFVPLYALGFAAEAVYVYLVFVSFHAVFIHANVRVEARWLAWALVMPRYHHWHHATAPVDRNFAVHLPLIDRVFGTQHCPPREWPAAYGVAGYAVPPTYLGHLVSPFRRTG